MPQELIDASSVYVKTSVSINWSSNDGTQCQCATQ